MPWLCQDVIGAVMPSSSVFRVRLQTESDGTATIPQIERAVKQFSEVKGVKFNYPIQWVIDVLVHLGLSLEHPKNKGLYIFPCHIKDPKSTTAWAKDASKPVYVGRRVQCQSKLQIITPGSFPIIQSEAYKAMIVKEVWEGGIKVQAADAVDLEAVIEVTDKDLSIQSIDIIARGALHSQGDCLRFMDSIYQLVMKVLDRKSPGTTTERCYLSHSSITQHEDCLASYSEKDIRDAQKDPQAVVRHKTGKDRLIDIVAVNSNHIILMPLSVRQELCAVLDQPDTNQPDWKMVGKALGIQRAANMKSTSHMLDAWSQSMTATADQLVAVLQRPDIKGSDALEVLGYVEQASKGIITSTGFYLICANLN